MGTEGERVTDTETMESAVPAQEETETLNETLESAVEGEEGVKDEVNVGGDGGIIENTVLETEMLVEKTFLCSNGSDGGFVGDSKKTGSPAVEGLTDSDSTMLNGDGYDKEMESDQNGVSIVVEVRCSLDSLNEEAENCEHKEGSVAGNEENPGEESIKIPGSEGNENFEATNKGGESHGEGEEDEGDQEHEYSVGDFVWGKIRSHPWWPGRIYDPTDASEYARNYSQGEKLLVAYFGDESFSWCSPSQLKPFAEDFGEMWGQSNSASFENAVQNAVDEIGKLGELKMTCYCISGDNQIGLHTYAATNVGIKEGVLVPNCDLNKLSPLNGPTYLLSVLRYVAEVVSITSLLEFTLLKSWLSAFYRAKGGRRLSLYYEPMFIADMEDKSRNVGVTVANDFSGVVEVPFGRPVEEDWVSWPVHSRLGQANQSLLQKCPGIAADKHYERRKKKTVAELVEEDMVVKPDNTRGSLVKNVTTGKLMKTSGKGKGKSNDEAESQDGSDLFSPSGKKRGKGKRSETEGPAKSQENKVRRERNGGGEREDGTQKNDSVSSVGNNNTVAREETGKGLVSGRKRGRRKRVETQESAKKKVCGAKNGGGQGEEVTKSSDGMCRVGNEHTNAKAENEKDLASGKKRGRRKRMDPREFGERKVPREKNGDGAGEEGTEKNGISNILEDDTNVNVDKGWASRKKRGRRKRVETQESGETKVSGEKNGGGDNKEGTKRKNGVSNIGNDITNANEETEKGLGSVRNRGEGRKEETRGSEKYTEKEVLSVKSGGCEGKEKTEEDNVLSVEIDDGNTKEETDKGLASRERKKSKYLSPPFTSLEREVRNSNPEKDYLEAESEKIVKVARTGERMINAAGRLITSPPVVNFSEEPKVETIAISTPNPPIEDQKKIIDSVQIIASIKEVVTEVRSAAINPLHLKEKNTIEMFMDFHSAFKSSMYLNGSNYNIYHRHLPSRKRKLPSSGPDTEIPESKSPWKRNEKKEQEISGVQKFEKDGGELGKKMEEEDIIDKEKGSDASTPPVSLIVTFPSGFSLPSKNDLKALFSKFGALDESETEVLYNCSCAMVVFVKSSDAEEAFNTSVKQSPFGPAKVSYRLRYSLDDYQSASPPPNEASINPVDHASRVLFTVKEKLELMASMLTKSDGNMLNEVHSKLEVEVKGLLEEVNTVVAKSTTASVE